MGHMLRANIAAISLAASGNYCRVNQRSQVLKKFVRHQAGSSKSGGSGMAMKILDVDTPLIPLSESYRFCRECLVAVGTPTEHADAQAAVLVEADYRGHYSHGMNRLEMYVNEIKEGTCESKNVPCILNETPATAWVDGKNTLGAVIGNFCNAIAIKKAKEVGVGIVGCKRSNHYGIAGWYAMKAVAQGLIGLSFCNTSPFMVPTRGIKPALGTNPISFAAPGEDCDSFVLDMATTAVAIGKVEIAVRKNAPIPEGWAMDDKGHVTTDSKIAFKTKRVMPLGGVEANSGYKGFGLGMMVEILSAILNDSKYGKNVRQWGSSSKEEANLGHCFIAINPKCFAPGFEKRMSDLMNTIRNMEPVDKDLPILIAGDPERLHMEAVDEAGGVKYVPNQMKTCAKLAKDLCVKPLKPLKKTC